MEKKIYVVDTYHYNYDEEKMGLPCDLSDDDFAIEAEEQKGVFTLKQFEQAFNFEGVINPENQYIRIF